MSLGKPVHVRVSNEEWLLWRAAAGSLGVSGWLRLAAREKLRRDGWPEEAVAPRPLAPRAETVVPVVRPRDGVQSPLVTDLRTQAQRLALRSGRCAADTPRGTRCKLCGKEH